MATGTRDNKPDQTVFVVRGTVSYIDGGPATGLVVQAFDRDLRSEQVLGKVQTDGKGFYEIRYTTDQFARAEKASADLLVRVYNAAGQVLYDPGLDGVLFNAPPEAVINILLNFAQTGLSSEYERLLRDVQPLLLDVKLPDLREDEQALDITFLTRETGWATDKLNYLVVAFRLQARSQIDPDFFYALLRQGMPLQNDVRAAVEAGFAITVNSDLQGVFYSQVLIDEAILRKAVEKSIREAIVPADLAKRLAGAIKQLKTFQDEAQAYFREEQSRKLFNLVQTNLASGKVDEFVQVFQQDAFSDLSGFFDRLGTVGILSTPQDVKRVKTQSAVADLLGFDQHIIRKVMAVKKFDQPEDVRKLAELNPSEWRKLLKESSAEIQPPGTKLDERLIKSHASKLARNLEKRFPSEAFNAQILRDKKNDLPYAGPLRQTLKKEPDFNLLTTNIDDHFKGVQAAKLSKKDPQAAKEQLKAAQRIFKIAPTYRQANALLGDHIHSANAIARLGENRFVEQYSGRGVFTRTEAKAVYQKAVDTHVASLFLAGELLDYAHGAPMAALDIAPPAETLKAVIQDYPNLKTLFQGIDICQCEECRSVFGPAAYMVDVLEFLKNRAVYDTTVSPALPNNAKDVLYDRRPDLGDIDLTCDNSLTPLPYIDIVNELLEETIAPDPGIPYSGPLANGQADSSLVALVQSKGYPATAQALVYEYGPTGNIRYMLRDQKLACKIDPDGANWRIFRLRQTFEQAAELDAAPEYLNTNAYDTLRTSPYAFHLPFDLYHREAQGYFGQFGIPRADLMHSLQIAAGPQEALIAADALGISEDERLLIITPDVPNQKLYWNTGANPPVPVLEVVDTFLTKSELTYDELVRLLGLVFINPADKLFIQHLDDTCDTAQKKIVNLDEPALDRMHRFIRLQRHLGWSLEALDQAVMATKIGAGSLDCLPALANVQKLSVDLGLPVEQIIAFYSYLPYKGENSPYARIFVNKSANGFVEDGLKAQAVLDNEVAPPMSQKKLVDYSAELVVILGMTSTEFGKWSDTLGAGAIVSMANLAALVAYKRLSKATKLKVDDFLILQALSGIDPLASPKDTQDFLTKATELRMAGTTPTELRFLLNHEADNLAERELPDKDITSWLEKLQDGYQKAYADSRPPFDSEQTADENKAGLRETLGKLPGMAETDLAAFMDLVDGVWNPVTPTPAGFIDSKLVNFFDTTAIKAAQTALGIGPTVKDTKPVERNAFIKSIQDSLADYFYTQAKFALLAGMVAGTFKTTESLTAVLLGSAHLKEPISAGNKLLGELLSTDDLIDKINTPPVKPAITPGAFPHQFEALRLLQKISPYASGLGLRADEIAWLLDHSEALGWLELDHIPYQGGQPSQALAEWEMLVGALTMVKDYPAIVNPDDNASAITVYSFFELVLAGGTTVNDVAAYLARLAGWDETLVKDLDGYFVLSTPDLSSYQDPATFRKLERAIVFLRRLGSDLVTGQTYLKARLTISEVQTLRQALKSNYSDADWLGVLKGIQDPLREQKRDALVAYLLAVNPDIKDSNDLYDIFLIDTQMSACGPTSRIVQAHGTLQLFVQRCLLGLEPTAVADAKLDQGWKQWQWMENYRVWEANRKVFVYPENWIEPELRDDKSPFFEDIETFFKQNELTEHNVEDATASYLEKLDDVALLEVQAVYYQTDIFTMHVFARTRGGDPYTYYYRRLEKERSWTPWEKVDLDISGDHLMAFVRNSRLYLAWPVFTEDADTNPNIPLPAASSFGSGNAQKSLKRWKLQMAISEFNGKKWLPKKISRDALVGNQYYNRLPTRTDFHFMPLDLGVAGFGFLCTYLDNGLDANGNEGNGYRRLMGSFSLTGCKGVPIPFDGGGVNFPLTFLPDFKETSLSTQHFTELTDRKDNDLAIRMILNPYMYAQILQNTPGRFKVTYPFQMSLIDWLLALLYFLLMSRNTYTYRETAARRGFLLPLGTFMPWFFEDYSRVYAVVPGFYGSEKQQEAGQVIEKTFSDILIFTQKAVNLALIYWGKLQADPAHDLQKLLDELVKDDTFQDLLKELGEFMASQYGYKFKNFYHPLVCYLRETLYKNGIPGLMQPEVQLQDTGFDFSTAQNYNPTPAVIKPYPREDIDFARDGGYAGYNWELFFHLPFEIAVKLSQDQQFEAAMDWFHYIFNPLGARDGVAPQKYWVTKPFFQHTTSDYVSQRIDTILNKLATGVGVDDLKYAVSEWRDKPFMPHVIARSRLVAYQKAVVMKYLDNLIAWGDYLFRQDTMESVNQATQFYVLADRLLGPKPRLVPPAVDTPPETYSQLESKLDVFSNALLDLENLVPDLGLLPHGGAELPPAPITLSSLYFCIPQNENLLAYWDLVGDRLFKIRNCQNIDGVERQLALFAPPIDPGALVRAAAAGLSVADILKGLNAPLPAYRFKVMVKKAQELAQQVNGLGSALLQALEKRDSEKLGLLRSSQEIQLLQAVRAYKKVQVDEAQVQIEAVQKSIEVTQARMDYYRSRPFMSPGEQAAQDLNTLAAGLQIAASSMDIAATVAHLIPDLQLGASGFGGSPHASAKFGGINFGNSSMTAADMLRSLAGNFQILAGLTSTQAGYQRRKDDWDFQGDQASKEIVQLQRQQLAAEIRHNLADMDVQNQDLQITNAQAVDAYLHDKFTNDELYDWMVGQISGVYFQAYQLALNIARKAERCYHHELGRDDSFIAAGYWDNLKKGLQAADQLVYDLNRMETAYLDQNKREYELTKHASLVQIDPLALAELKSKGKCTFTLPEAVFDLDQPGHYFRRLKSVSLSIPCVTGPYTSVSAKLSLVSNKYRKVITLNAGGPKDSYIEDPGNDNRFAYNLAGIQSIATSRAQEDSGLFELNFSDERYLPFEGAGAISVWQLELPDKLRAFDYNTISDVIVHMKYTARDGGSHFKSIVEQALFELLSEMVLSASKTGLYQAFSLRQSFAEAFYRLKTDKTLTMQITEQMLPFYTQDHTPNLEGVTFLARLKNNPASYAMTLNAAALNLSKTPTYGNLCTGTPMPNPLSLATDFTLAAANTDDLEDLMIVVRYTLGS